MILSLFLLIFTLFLLGFVFVSLLWPGRQPIHNFVKASLAAGLGAGLISVILFIWLLVFGSGKNFILFETALLLPLMFVLFYTFNKKHAAPSAAVQDEGPSETGLRWMLRIVLLLMLASSLFAFIVISVRQPHGGRDAWIVWNSHARFIFRSGEHWQNVFSNVISWSQPDYPLLVPLSIVHGWEIVGSEALSVPALLSALFTFSTALLLLSSLAALRSEAQGLLAGLILLGTPSFIRAGTTQFADVPLAFFFLSTIVFLAFYDRTSPENRALLFLAGMSAGLSTWTKNEGFLFLVSIIAARSVVVIKRRGWKEFSWQIRAFSAGLLPILLVVLYFKIFIATPNDLVSGQGLTATLSRLTDPARYFLILKEYVVQGMGATRCGLPLLAIYLFLLGKNTGVKDRAMVNTGLLTVVLMLAGYFFVYVTSPNDLIWQVKTSLGRLILQIWPSFIFCFFMLADTPERVLSKYNSGNKA